MTTDSTIFPPADVPIVETAEDAQLRAQTATRAIVFTLTWLAYAGYYFGRMGFPVVKSTLQKKLGLSVDMLGWIDTGYLTAYALGQFLSGSLGDRIGSRRLIGIGMLGVSLACTAFGLGSFAGVFLLSYIF